MKTIQFSNTSRDISMIISRIKNSCAYDMLKKRKYELFVKIKKNDFPVPIKTRRVKEDSLDEHSVSSYDSLTYAKENINQFQETIQFDTEQSNSPIRCCVRQKLTTIYDEKELRIDDNNHYQNQIYYNDNSLLNDCYNERQNTTSKFKNVQLSYYEEIYKNITKNKRYHKRILTL